MPRAPCRLAMSRLPCVRVGVQSPKSNLPLGSKALVTNLALTALAAHLKPT